MGSSKYQKFEDKTQSKSKNFINFKNKFKSIAKEFHVRQILNGFIWILMLIPYICNVGILSSILVILSISMVASILFTDYSLTRINH